MHRFNTRWGRSALFLAAVALFIGVFHPPFFNFDTYDYMMRGFYPSAYGAHPFLFGYLLRAVGALSGLLYKGAFSHLFQAWQLFCIGVAVVACLRDRKRRIDAPRGWRWLKPLLLGAATLGCLLPSLLFLANGYVTEPTVFALLAIGAMVFARAHDEPRRPALWLLFAAVCVVAYNVRYQLIALPAAAAVAVVARWARRRIDWRGCARSLVPIAGVLLLVAFSQRGLTSVLPADEFGKKTPEIFLRKSIQCTLGCSVRLFEATCETRRGRSLLMGPCWKLTLAFESELGQVHPRFEGIAGTLRSLEPGQLFTFLTRAPVNYLRSRQKDPLEIYGYTFNGEIPWFSEHFPDVLARYGALLPPVPDRPAPAFKVLLAYLEWLYRHWGFHWLTVLALYASIVGIVVTRDPGSACLYALTITTFFLFSYLQPQFPIRYAVHLTLPAFFAAWRDLLHPASAAANAA